MGTPPNIGPDRLPTELVAAIQRSDALMYLIIRPAGDGIPGSVSIDYGANGLSERHAAAALRHAADEWEALADQHGEPPLDVCIETVIGPIETREDFRT